MLKIKEEEYLDDSLQDITRNESNLEKLSTNKEYFISLFESGNNYLNSGNYWKSFSNFMTLLYIDPQNAFIWNKLAIVFIKLEKFDTAMAISRIAYKLINCESTE
ncbi:MAG: hypothetical protein EAX90_00625 [Candidatus Heimdallarchaeota archaeon]|nr:hypothetical protein [Candidatus Heimdallarchaeota archaeon]